MDERRHVHELDGNSRGNRRRLVRVGDKETEERAEPLPSGRKHLSRDTGGETWPTLNRPRETRFKLAEIGGQPGNRLKRFELTHPVTSATPVCRATMLPPSSVNRTAPKPASARRDASSSAPGNRFTDAGK